MLCPYCNTRYSWDEPCFCQPSVRPRVAHSASPASLIRFDDEVRGADLGPRVEFGLEQAG